MSSFVVFTILYSKQFLSLTDDDKTMIQLTVERISPIVDVENVYVVTNKDYKHLVKEQIPGTWCSTH